MSLRFWARVSGRRPYAKAGKSGSGRGQTVSGVPEISGENPSRGVRETD